MNDTPNTQTWPIGALVIHDADAKQGYMLMRVIGYTPDGLCVTRYAQPDSLRKGFPGKATYRNELRVMHDPKRFGL